MKREDRRSKTLIVIKKKMVLNMSWKTKLEIIHDNTSAYIWNKINKGNLNKIREALLQTEFNDGSNVEWKYFMYTWMLELTDRNGVKYEISTGWQSAIYKNPVKVYCLKTVYDRSHSRYYEIDLDILLGGDEGKIEEHVQFLKNELKEQVKIENYFVENIGNMCLTGLKYEENEEGEKEKVMGFLLGGYMNQWSKETIGITEELELRGTNSSIRGVILDTVENREIIGRIVEEYGTGEYKLKECGEFTIGVNTVKKGIINKVDIVRVF